jgi:hypothetical protein
LFAAAKLSSACSTVFAPGMIVDIAGWARIYWSAACASDVPDGASAANYSSSAARRTITSGDQRWRTSVKAWLLLIRIASRSPHHSWQPCASS